MVRGCQRLFPAVGSMALAAAAGLAAAAEDPAGDIGRGRAMAERLCAGCHAISGPGPSPLPEAPLFSRFERRWPVEYLEEALAEGIVTGHAAMPEFVFSPDEIGDLLAYLKSVQE